jgi:hypothetical protein
MTNYKQLLIQHDSSPVRDVPQPLLVTVFFAGHVSVIELSAFFTAEKPPILQSSHLLIRE